MRKRLPILVFVFLSIFSFSISAERADTPALGNEAENSSVVAPFEHVHETVLNRQGGHWISPVTNQSPVQLRAQKREEQQERNVNEETKNEAESLAPMAENSDEMVDTTQYSVDWEYYLSITSPEETAYKLLYYNHELEEVEYLYPTITLEEFIEEADPIIYSVFNASWLGQEEELKVLLEDLAERYGDVLFIMVDADSLPKESLSRYLVRELPFFLIFREGNIMSQVEGYHSGFSSAIEQSLVDILES